MATLPRLPGEFQLPVHSVSGTPLFELVEIKPGFDQLNHLADPATHVPGSAPVAT
jgi:hypothetical protein